MVPSFARLQATVTFTTEILLPVKRILNCFCAWNLGSARKHTSKQSYYSSLMVDYNLV